MTPNKSPLGQFWTVNVVTALWLRGVFWKLRRGIDAILQAKTVMGTTLEIVIGHTTFCSLLACPALSCLHSVCKYIQRIGPSRGILWDTVRDELRAFQCLMVLLVAAWDRGWVLVVLASDASEWGYGVPAMWSEAAKTGRVAERSRFRLPGVPSARAAAFQAAGDLQRWAQEVGVDEESLREVLPEVSGRWELDERFPEVPTDWRAKPLRKVLRGWPWQREENILLLAARALCTAVQIGCSFAGAGGARLLRLVDNMALCLSVGQSRARKFKLLRILRIVAGWTLSFGVALSVRWVPSAYNTGDDPSRSDGTCEDPLHANRVERCEEHILDQIHIHVSKNMLELISSFVKVHDAPQARISRRCSTSLTKKPRRILKYFDACS